MIKAICFDMDGILADTETRSKLITKDVVKELNISLSTEQINAFLGANRKTVSELLNTWFGGRVKAEDYDASWCRLMLEKLHQEGFPYMKGAKELLPALKKAGYLLALCTSNTDRVISEYLKATGWDEVFDTVVTGDMVHEGKPSPEIYLKAAELLNVRPDECMGVEDSLNGIKSVRAAGMTSVMIPDLLPYDAKTMQPYVDVLLDDLIQLQDRLIDQTTDKE